MAELKQYQGCFSIPEKSKIRLSSLTAELSIGLAGIRLLVLDRLTVRRQGRTLPSSTKNTETLPAFSPFVSDLSRVEKRIKAH